MKFKEYDQSQLILQITDLKSLVPRDDTSLVINNLVDRIEIGDFMKEYPEEGNTAYHPRMMLKILYYSYMNGVFSSRKIEGQLKRNVCYWYLSAKQEPDFRTIAMFRKRQKKLIEHVFLELNKIAIKKGMIDFKVTSIDGTKIKANASKINNWDLTKVESVRKSEKELKKITEDFLNQGEEADKQEELALKKVLIEKKTVALEKKKAIANKMEKALLASGEKQINSTDQDAKLMKGKDKYEVSYNNQVTTDKKKGMIISKKATSDGNDCNQISANMEKVKKDYKKLPEALLGDNGYCDGPSLRYLKENNIDGYIAPTTGKSIWGQIIGKEDASKKFSKNKFFYDKSKDYYTCPSGQLLKRKSKKTYEKKTKYGVEKYYIYRGSNCKKCPNYLECCSKKETNKKIGRYLYEDIKDDMWQKLKTTEGYEMYGQRMWLAEGVFGNIKHNLGFTYFRLRGLSGVNTELTLISTAHNLKKMAKEMQNELQQKLNNKLLELKRVICYFTQNYFFLLII